MVGREGPKGNPWIFKRITHYLETGELLPGPTLMEGTGYDPAPWKDAYKLQG